MYARVSYYAEPPEQIDATVINWRNNVRPGVRRQMKELGLKDHGAMVLVDRGSGQSLSISFWETEDEMRASEEQAARSRGEIADAGGGNITGVERYEVVIDEREQT
jgi:hypothetical protein